MYPFYPFNWHALRALLIRRPIAPDNTWMYLSNVSLKKPPSRAALLSDLSYSPLSPRCPPPVSRVRAQTKNRRRR